MYIIEKLIKLYLNIKSKKTNYERFLNNESYETEDVLTCQHNFMPLDSTNEIFACTKCGYIATKKRLKNIKH